MNAINIPRRLLLGGAVGALALPSRTAQADTSFTNFSFAATGAPTARTMPDRLNDVINVKDWGAKGDGVTDDTSAIQAAIDYCISRGGGRVFFPCGNYRNIRNRPFVIGTNNSNQANNGVELIGSGYESTIIGGRISKGGRTYDLISRLKVSSSMVASRLPAQA
jgi:hypothetical protein